MTAAIRSHDIVVHSQVPFGHLILFQLKLSGHQLDDLVRHDGIEQRYLAWEEVRKARSPFFVHGTGFEGYFVGICSSPEDALERILVVNQNILDAIARVYRFEYGFRSRLMKTLTREASDSRAIHIWSSYLGAALARLRCQCMQNPLACRFRDQTYDIVRYLPVMDYQVGDGHILQTYVLEDGDFYHTERLEISAHLLSSKQQDAWLVAENIGEFGHPLVRQLLDVA